jgi:hypothetical protein
MRLPRYAAPLPFSGRWQVALGILLTGLWLILALDGAFRLSPTMDETTHLPAGLTSLTHGDHRFNPEHPPLVKFLSALPPYFLLRPPVIFDPGNGPYSAFVEGNQWVWGHIVLYYSSIPAMELISLGRLAPITLGLLGGLLTLWLAYHLSGRNPTAALLAMILLLFYPEYLGHARYITFDVPVILALTILAAVGILWYKKPSRSSYVFFLLALAALPLIKLPVLVAAAIIGLTIFAWVLISKPRLALPLVFLGTGALFTQAILYWTFAGFRFDLPAPDLPPLTGFVPYLTPRSDATGLFPTIINWIDTQRLLPRIALAPWNHLEANQARFSYLLGEYQVGGWPHYFAVTTLVKSTPTQLLLLPPAIIAAIQIFRRGSSHRRLLLLLLILPALVLLLLTVQSHLNIGHRHILFIYLPWSVLGGVALAHLIRHRSWGRWLALALIGFHLTEALRTHPHQATYFNLIGGNTPARGIEWVGDSNADWGQDLAIAANIIRQKNLGPVNLAIFGTNLPDAYGILQYRFILKNYEWSLGMPEPQPPNPQWWSVVSVVSRDFAKSQHPGFFNRPHDFAINSLLFYRPLAIRRSPAPAPLANP